MGSRPALPEQPGSDKAGLHSAPGKTPSLRPIVSTARAKTEPEVTITRSAARPAAIRLSRRGGIAVLALILLMLCCGWAGRRVWIGWHAERAAVADVGALQALGSGNLAGLSDADLQRAGAELNDLDEQMRHLDAATRLPFGNSLVGRLPLLGPRYVAGRRLIAVGETLAGAGSSAVSLGRQVLAAYNATGASRPAPADRPTWLDIMVQHQAGIQAIAAQIEEAKRQRAEIDTAALPAAARAKLPALDRILNRYDLGTLADNDLPPLAAALGADHPVRYLVLFQNPAELRLSGGYAGTLALVTIDRGQLLSYQFYDMQELELAYDATQNAPISPPMPVERYFGYAALAIRDADWGTDFAKDGALLMQMYAKAGWPPINGVVGLTPAVVSDLLRITGPFNLDVDGETRRITADNVQEEIERQRRLHQGITLTDNHKEVLALVGQALVQRLKSTSRGQMVDAAKALKTAAAQRDLQIYSADPKVEAALDAHRWSGRLVPDPTLPTLSVDFSSLTTTKASQAIYPSFDLLFDPVTDGRRRATLTIELKHTGSSQGDPYYDGAQRWWVEINLPSGSQRISSDQPLVADPAAPNGGSYDLLLDPSRTVQLTVVFTLPATDQLLVRRQPGVNPVSLTVAVPNCQTPYTTKLTRDTTLSLGNLCQ